MVVLTIHPSYPKLITKHKMKYSLVLVALLACQAVAAPTTDSKILKTLQTKKSATVIVSLKGNNVAALRNQFQLQTFSTRTQKINSFYHLLKNHADTTQANVLSFLSKEQSDKPIVVEQLWISNQIIVRQADFHVVEKLLSMDEVADVREERLFPLEEPIDTIVHPEGQVPFAGEQWGVANIRAPEVWATGNRGAGVVIGSIDTGVLVTHEALQDGHRTDYGWFDPYQGTKTPNDQNGHGTHTAGTIAGRTNGVGVAPEAQWIACKGCDTRTCSETALLTCGQWMSCPTDTQGKNADCSKAPNAVSNSWGGDPGDAFYDDIIGAWKVANIAPIFSIGNEGEYGCGTAGSPGDSIDAISVGSTTSSNGLSYFSSLGPTKIGQRLKPEIAAPGHSVVSASHLSDKTYATKSGTSMACPHVAGLAALLYSEKPQLTYSQIRSALIAGAQPVAPSGNNCGGISETKYPNNAVGYGRIDAFASLNVVKGF